MQSLDQYLAGNGLQGKVDHDVVAQIKRLHRVYQVTPSDQAMITLLARNTDSAYRIVSYGKQAFVAEFQDAMGGAGAAELTYAKAQQIYNAVLNLTTDYILRGRTPVLGSGGTGYLPGFGGSAASNPAASATLQTLFNNLDYCACEECRSILGPAAYLVDLLNFADRPASGGSEDPQSVLLARRPDLQYLPLTCANTNTALPYIDVVNEILEAFAADGSLASFQGKSTDDSVTSAELLAIPQNVNDTAYENLLKAFFPPPLPFHRPLELLRRLFQQFGVRLADAMYLLRPSDAIEAPTGGYGWRDILLEQFGCSRQEQQILANSVIGLEDQSVSLAQLYGYPAAQSDQDTAAKLSSVPDFAARTGVSYEDLVSILQTSFINPSTYLIPLLEKLNVSFTVLQQLKSGAISPQDFQAKYLPQGTAAPDPADYGGNIAGWILDPARYAQIMSLVTITNTNPADPDLCSMANLQFKYSDPSPAATLQPADFLRLIRFIRLWRKLSTAMPQLGNVIARTDDIITALTTGADLRGDTQLLDAGFFGLLPRIGVLSQVMSLLGVGSDRDVQSLLACWAPIGTSGSDSLYASMFLTPAQLQADLAFAPGPDGSVLTDTSKTLPDHETALRAASGLTHAEFAAISTQLGYTSTTPLTLANISAVYRHAWLARALQISVTELLLLLNYTGLDPFTTPDPSGTGPAEPAMIRLIRLVQAMQNASLEPVQALYLLWNQDINGNSAPADADIAALALSLRTDFLAVDSQFAVQDDPTGAITQSLLTLVYGSSAAGFFAGLLNNTFSVSAPYAGAVPPAVTAASGDQPVPGQLPRLSYDGVALQLTFTGILDPATFSATQAAAAGNAPLLTALSQLQSASQAATGPFFTQYPELQQALAGYLASSDAMQTKRGTLLAGLLPALQAERRQQQALAAITAAAGVDGTFATALLTDAAVLHSAAQAAVGGSPKTGDILTTTISGAAVTYTVTASSAVTAVAAAIAATINAATSPDPVSGQPLNAVLRASADGGAVTIRTLGHGQLPAIAFAASSGAGATYTASPAIGDLTALDAQGLTGQFFLSNDPSGPPDQTADADPALSYSPTATVGQTPTPGDVLTTTINGVPVKYQVASTDTTAAAIAGQIASAISAATDPDPVSGLALNAVVKASANGPVVVIEAAGPGGAPGVVCAVSSGATESYVPGSQLPGGGPGPVAGTWSGYVAAPQDGEYFFAITTDAGAAVALIIGGAEVPVTQDGNLWRSGPVPLIAGSLTAIIITATGLRANLSLSWQSKGIGLQLIPAGCMYSQTLMDRLRATYTRFLKATSLASSLSADAAELVFLTQEGQLRVHGQGWPSALAVAGNPDAASAAQFCDVLTGLLAFARLKHALSPRDDRLLDALQDLRSQLGQGPPYDTGKLIALTRWDPDSLTSLLQRFAALTGGNAPPALSHVANLARVYDAYRMVKACGVAAAALLAAATNDPAAAMVATFQAALAARYAASDWLAVIKPINDAMRGLQRDALVPYVLQLLAARSPATMVDVDTPVTTPDTLYEYLLADVAMDPCLQTSRIQFAISAVQLFIERSLRALETSSNSALNVDPAVFGPDAPAEWSWMKRYRVWQANREVFLWPENWAYPELRDDQTPEFTAIMGKLLQSDITDDTAATAYLDYLTDLEKIAKLETCGMYYVSASTSPPANEVTHVIARSTGASRTYYYRAYDGVSWSPWEEIPLKIPDNPVLPVVWNNRLLLFWLQVAYQQAPGGPAAPDDSQGPTLAQARISDVVKSIGAVTPSVQVQLTLFWSEYCNGKWQQAKSSDPNNPALLVQSEKAGLDDDGRQEYSFVTTFSAGAVQQSDLALTAYPEPYPPGGHQDRLWIVIWRDGQAGADFLFYNTHSSPVADVADPYWGLSFPTQYLDPSNYERKAQTGTSGELELDYSSSGDPAGFSTYPLTGRLPPSIVEPQHPMRGDTGEATWRAPFCFADTVNVFYVEASIGRAWIVFPLDPAGFARYGVTAHLPSLARRAAPLALRGPALASAQVPRRQDPANSGQTLAAVDGSRLGSFVQKDPYISRALGTTGVVRYGSISIGATGAVADAGSDGKGET